MAISSFSNVLLTKQHLLNPLTHLKVNPKPIVREKIITGCALTILGLVSVGMIPLFYCLTANRKIKHLKKLNKLGMSPSPVEKTAEKAPLPKNLSQAAAAPIPAPRTPVDLPRFFQIALPPAKPASQAQAQQATATPASAQPATAAPVQPTMTPAQPTAVPAQPSSDSSIATLQDIFKPDYDYISDLASQEEWIAENPPSKPIYTYTFIPPKPLKSPDFMGHLINSQAASLLVPAISVNKKPEALAIRQQAHRWLLQNPDWVGKRLKVQEGTNEIDVFLFGKKEDLPKKRFLIISNGNGNTSEEAFEGYRHLAEQLNATLIAFNYPEVGHSNNRVSRNGLVASNLAVCEFVETLNPKEVVYLGISIGGGVQGTSHKYQPFTQTASTEKEPSRVFVKYQTFTNLRDTAYDLMQNLSKNGPADVRLKLSAVSATIGTKEIFKQTFKSMAWQLKSTKTSKMLAHPEIIVQTAKTPHPKEASDIISDSLFSPENSLAHNLLQDGGAANWPRKKFIGTQAMHGTPPSQEDLDRLIASIREALEPGFTKFSVSA